MPDNDFLPPAPNDPIGPLPPILDPPIAPGPDPNEPQINDDDITFEPEPLNPFKGGHRFDSEIKPMDAGRGFDYAVWAPGTRITLTNVTWDSTYRDIVAFASQADLDRYLTNPPSTNGHSTNTLSVDNMSYARIDQPIRIAAPFNQVNQFNYVRVANSNGPHERNHRVYYYFITNVEYVAPETTAIHVQLDVWQTFGRDIRFGRVYVERGHIGIANSNAYNPNANEFGLTYLSVPEGFDLGSNYMINQAESRNVIEKGSAGYIISSTTDLTAEWGTISEPRIVSARGSTFGSVANGISLYYVDNMWTLQTLMFNLQHYPWIGQGIVSITAVPRVLSLPTSGWINPADRKPGTRSNGMISLASTNNPPQRDISMLSQFREKLGLPNRFRHLHKFKTAPYCQIEVTTFSGTPIYLRPELLRTRDLHLRELPALAPPNPRIMYAVKHYSQLVDNGPAWSEYMGLMTGFPNLPTFSGISNNAALALASQTHSLAYHKQNADWSQQRALTAAQVARDNIDTMQDLERVKTGITTGTIYDQTALTAGKMRQDYETGTWGRWLGAGVQGASSGTISGALSSLANAGIGQLTSHMDLTNSLAYQSSMASLSIGQNLDMHYANKDYGDIVADANMNFARYAARTNYEATLAGLAAKVQDIELTPPGTVGQIGGDSFLLQTDGWRLYARVKTIPAGARDIIGEYWLRYGYAVQRFITMPSNYLCMTNFTYWKLKEAYLQATAAPEMVKMAIKGMFERGVTVWRRPELIPNHDIANNDPLSGVSF